ncbi:FKBP12-associated protein [Steccherinum ochraceum]|uniref:FKBP12-associated protein n=1 Tax=Steccherinum ochraceum TaxID=92696 RepID=A0A4R0RNH9_9APHY|nr:FKBP12-associated protein [Steccherinum ochraceum]
MLSAESHANCVTQLFILAHRHVMHQRPVQKRSHVVLSSTSPVLADVSFSLFHVAARNARLADALGVSVDRTDSRSHATYHDSLIVFARGDPNFCAMVEKSFSDFITSEKRSQVLPHMHPSRRKFVHDLAAVYRMDTQMVDQEPKRSVELIRRIDTRIPSPTLSSTISAAPASSSGTSTLGRLADLRAPVTAKAVSGRSLNTSPAPGASSSSRAWTSIVSRPQAPPQAPKASASASTWRRAALPQPEAPRPAASRLVPLGSSASKPSVPVPASGGEVPDSWEDES